MTALACAMLGLAVTARASFASLLPPPGGDDGGPVTSVPAARTVTRVIVIGGMPGWQIALIAVGACDRHHPNSATVSRGLGTSGPTSLTLFSRAPCTGSGHGGRPPCSSGD